MPSSCSAASGRSRHVGLHPRPGQGLVDLPVGAVEVVPTGDASGPIPHPMKAIAVGFVLLVVLGMAGYGMFSVVVG